LSWDVAITALALITATIATFSLTRPLIGQIASGILAALIPIVFFRWLRRRTAQRVERFIAQLPEVSRLLSNGTSAGVSIERSLALAAQEMSDPARAELSRATSTSTCSSGWRLMSVSAK